MKQIAPGVRWVEYAYVMNSYARSHAYVLGDKRPILVECASSEKSVADEWILFGRENDVCAVVATHHHADHTQYLEHIADGIGCPIVGPTRPQVDESSPTIPVVRIDHVVSEGDELEGWRVLETPGHQNEHICLYNAKTETLVLGDAAKIGLGAHADWVASLKRLIALRPAVALPAHGQVYLEGSFAPVAHWRITGAS